MGRYTHKIAISNHRITDIKKDSVTFKYKDYKIGGKNKTMKLPALEFIRRFSLHILPPHFRKIRHFGALANRNKSILKILKERLELAWERPFLNKKNKIGRKMNNPYLCPYCKKGKMVTVALSIPSGLGRSPPKKIRTLNKQINKNK